MKIFNSKEVIDHMDSAQLNDFKALMATKLFYGATEINPSFYEEDPEVPGISRIIATMCRGINTLNALMYDSYYNQNEFDTWRFMQSIRAFNYDTFLNLDDNTMVRTEAYKSGRVVYYPWLPMFSLDLHIGDDMGVQSTKPAIPIIYSFKNVNIEGKTEYFEATRIIIDSNIKFEDMVPTFSYGREIPDDEWNLDPNNNFKANFPKVFSTNNNVKPFYDAFRNFMGE